MLKKLIPNDNVRILSFLIDILFILSILFPVGTLVFSIVGYNFIISNVPAFTWIVSILFICTVIFDLTHKCTIEKTSDQILTTLMTPLSLVNAVFLIFEYTRIEILPSVLISSLCCCFLTIKHGKPFLFKLITLILSALMTLPVIFFIFMLLTFGSIGKDTVIQMVDSPNHQYYAEVVDSDQGALGGDTYVVVYEKKCINLVLFKIQKKPQRVYWGEWGAYNGMKIHWENDHCLIINSTEYEIK